MRPWIWGTIVALSLSWTGLSEAKELSPREIYELASPAVVMVMGYPDGGRKGSGGTGSIIRPDGYVLTNAHVVVDEQTSRPFSRISVFLKPARVTGDSKSDLSRLVRAKVVAFSQPLDLALLKLDNGGGTLPVVAVEGSEHTKIGDRVVAIGHPEQGGLWTLTTGVISAEVDNFNNVKGKHVFQTETGLNRGNSGGPLLDSEGHMIAVNTAIARVAPDGLPITSISFSLKSSVALQWLREQKLTASLASSPAVAPTQIPAASDPPVIPPVRPQSEVAPPTPPKSVVPAKPTVKPDMEPSMQARPYDLDKLINDRAKAEADLEGMITEMRGRMKGR
jgi:serine protease Do